MVVTPPLHEISRVDTRNTPAAEDRAHLQTSSAERPLFLFFARVLIDKDLDLITYLRKLVRLLDINGHLGDI